MPTEWNAGIHDVKLFSEDGQGFLRCKCGWEQVLEPEVKWDPTEPWRDLADRHINGTL